jgi:hypothetical protein
VKFRRTLPLLAVLASQTSGQQTGARVDVYMNRQDDSDRLLGAGRPMAVELFKNINVRLIWHKGEVPPGRSGLIVRTVERAPECATGEALATTRMLGSTREITVYKDRVERFLDVHRSLARVACGYVLAHELAHAIQGIAHHSQSGIMKAHWSNQDFHEMLFHKLGFAPSDVELIHRGLAGR